MLSLSGITLAYDDSPVLRLDSLQLNQGEHCVITGSSGNGKTTLLYAIAGLVDVMKGSISVSGTEISTLSEAQRDHFRGRYIGIIFQTLHLVHSLTVMENLMLASYAADMPQNQTIASELLNKLGIYEKKDALPQTLSQGQAQRVAIARAVLHRPSLILADEPTSSLDDSSCESVITLIKQMAEETNATLLIATHDSRVKEHFSNVLHLADAQ